MEQYFLHCVNIYATVSDLLNHWLYVSQHIKRYQLSADWILSYGDAKSKYSLKWAKLILRFHMFWNLYLIFKLLEGFRAKTVCSCKNGHLNCQNINTLYRFSNFKSLFLKINFSPICCDIFNEIPISQDHSPISKLFAPKLS